MKTIITLFLISASVGLSAPPPPPYSYMYDGHKILITSKRISPLGQTPVVFQFWKHDSLIQSSPTSLVWSWREYDNQTGVTIEDGYVFTRTYGPGGVPLDQWHAWEGWHTVSTTWNPGSGQPFTGTTNWFSSTTVPYLTRDSVPFSAGTRVTYGLNGDFRYFTGASSTKRLVNTGNSVWVWRQWFESSSNSGQTGTQVCVAPGGSSLFSPVMGNAQQTFDYVYAVDQWNGFVTTCPYWEAP